MLHILSTMRFFVVLALACVFALTVNAADPEFPINKVCSITGTGNFTYMSEEGEVCKGNGTMRRVNGVAIYDFKCSWVHSATKKDEDFYCNGALLIRPDLGWVGETAYVFKCKSGRMGAQTGDEYINISRYKYNSTLKPIPGMNYNTYYAYDKFYPSMAMLFTPDNSKLIAEWFKEYDGENNITIIYDSVEEYEHNEVDDAFSYEVKDEPSFNRNATTAITSLCKSVSSSNSEKASAATILPSFVGLVIAAFVLVFF